MPYETGATLRGGVPCVYDSGNYEALLDKVLELADYNDFPARQAAARAADADEGGPLGKLERPPVHLLGARPASASSGEEVQDGGESLRDLLERERGLRRLRRRVRLHEAERGNGGVVADRHRVRGASENRVEREVP